MHVEPEAILEDRLWDQQAVRGDDDGVGAEVHAGLGTRGLQDRNAEALRRLLRGRGRKLPAPPPRRVGTRQERRDVMPLRETLEDVSSERRGRRDGKFQRKTSRGRNAAIASRRASGEVRSSMSLPSRWSYSCCTMRAAIPSRS